MSESKRLDIVLDAGSLNGSIPSLPFAVTFEGEAYRVLQLFDATVELEAKRDGYKCTLRKSSVLVDPDVIQWYPATKPTPPRQPEPKLRVVPEGIEEKEVSGIDTTPRTCRNCNKEKPAKEFDRAGIYAKYCHECKPLVKAARAAGPAGQVKSTMIGGTNPIEVKVITGGQPIKVKRSYKKRQKGRSVGKPSNMKPSGHKNGRPALTFKELIGDLRSHITFLRKEHGVALKTIDELQAEKAALFAEIQELVASA